MKTISMIALTAILAFSASAQETLEEINSKLNELGGEKIELSGAVRDFKAKLRQSANDPKVVSGAIMEKRKQLSELMAKIVALQEDISLEVAKTPQFIEGYVKMTNNIARLAEIDAQRKELLSKRAKLEK